MDSNVKMKYIELLKKEISPALGCTEPAAVALCAAGAAALLDQKVKNVVIQVSSYILKNGMNVGIPGFGSIGLDLAGALGAVCARPEKELLVLDNLSEREREEAEELMRQGLISLDCKKEKTAKIYISVKVYGEDHTAEAVIEDKHTNFTRKIRDDVVLWEREECQIQETTSVDDITLDEIWDFVQEVPGEQLSFLLDLYNLYIIAADMENENTGSHTFDFNQYFQGEQADDAKLFAWALDAEDFYEKGPSYAGQDETYTIAQPLLDDFFSSIDERVNGGSTVATFRFAHAETMMPFAALLGLPGSIQQAAASTTDVYTYANNEWRGESVTPMAANVQWDVAVKSGNDPKTGRAYTPLVRMLYNEQEIAFRSECTPIADGSTWYKLTELKSCLASDHQTLGDDAHLTDDSTTQPGTGPNTGEGTSTTPNNNGAGTHQPSNTQANGTENELSRTGVAVTGVAGIMMLLALAGISLNLWKVRR